MWKLMTRAFQWCITLYSRKWTVWPWEAIFCQKLPEKNSFFQYHDSGWTDFRGGWDPQFSKSRHFSHVSKILLGSHLKFFLEVSRKKCEKGIFWCLSGKNFQVAANRTILTPATFPIAHLKAYALKFSGNMWKMQRLWKLGVPVPSKVTWSRFVSA